MPCSVSARSVSLVTLGVEHPVQAQCYTGALTSRGVSRVALSNVLIEYHSASTAHDLRSPFILLCPPIQCLFAKEGPRLFFFLALCSLQQSFDKSFA
jgi:hypothetical protein